MSLKVDWAYPDGEDKPRVRVQTPYAPWVSMTQEEAGRLACDLLALLEAPDASDAEKPTGCPMGYEGCGVCGLTRVVHDERD